MGAFIITCMFLFVSFGEFQKNEIFEISIQFETLIKGNVFPPNTKDLSPPKF